MTAGSDLPAMRAGGLMLLRAGQWHLENGPCANGGIMARLTAFTVNS